MNMETGHREKNTMENHSISFARCSRVCCDNRENMSRNLYEWVENVKQWFIALAYNASAHVHSSLHDIRFSFARTTATKTYENK